MRPLFRMTRALAAGITASCIAIVGVTTTPATAEFPEKPVKIIVPYAPGGSTDVLIRLTAQYLEPVLGQTVVITNISGAGGSVGMLEATRSRPDGYTMGIYLTNTEVAMATGVAAFKPEDIAPVALMGDLYLTLTGKGGSQFASMADMKTEAAKRPGEVSIAMGQGTLAHFAAVQIEEALGEDLKLVNVGGGAKKKAAVLGNHVDTLMEPSPGVLAQHEAGELHVIAVLSPERLPFLPEVPTAREQGFDVVSIQTMGFFVPTGTPEDHIAVLSDAIAKLGENAEFRTRLDEFNLIWSYKNSADLADYALEIRSDIQKTAKIIQAGE